MKNNFLSARPFVPNVALSQYALQDLLPLPSAPIQLDLGTGLGHFVVGMANKATESNWIGLETDGKILKRAVKRVRKNAPGNALLFAIDARPFLLESVPPGALDHIWINFPDPWPKKRHAFRRHTHPWMLGLLISRLKVGGELHLATDIPAYLSQMIEGMAATALMTTASDSPQRRETIGVETKYERKWRKYNRPLYFGDWRKISAGGDSAYPFTRQAPPNIRFAAPPRPGVYGNERYRLKIFSPRPERERLNAGFIFIDRETGINTPGYISLADGQVHLRGAWTDWKVGLISNEELSMQSE